MRGRGFRFKDHLAPLSYGAKEHLFDGHRGDSNRKSRLTYTARGDTWPPEGDELGFIPFG